MDATECHSWQTAKELTWETGVRDVYALQGNRIMVSLSYRDEGAHDCNHHLAASIRIAGIDKAGNPYIIIDSPGIPFTKRLVLYWGWLFTKSTNWHVFGWYVGRECDDFLFVRGRPNATVRIPKP